MARHSDRPAFIKAYNKRDPHENDRVDADPEARVVRNGKTYELSNKLHIAIEAKSEVALAVISALVKITRRNMFLRF